MIVKTLGRLCKDSILNCKYYVNKKGWIYFNSNLLKIFKFIRRDFHAKFYLQFLAFLEFLPIHHNDRIVLVAFQSFH